MSAPPGWHPQPDGRERWWDGQQWTEHFRDPVGTTQQYGAVGPGYGQGGQPTGYGAPGGQYPPQRSGMSRGAKGCLIAVVVFVVLALLAVVVAVFVFGASVKNAVDDVQQSIDAQSTQDSPDVVVIQVGQGFDVAGASVEDGWDVKDDATIGQRVDGMQATFSDDRSTPSLFTMRFTGEEGGDVETLCTAVPADGGGGTADVTCVPLFENVDPNGDVEVTPTL